MFTRIFVPLDGTPVSERALPYAEALARASDGMLLLMRAIPVLAPWAEVRRALAATAEPLEARRAKVEFRVGEVFEREGDTVADVLVHNARVWRADIVAIATRPRVGRARLPLGSVADRLLGELAVPILLIPPACERAWPSDGSLRVVVALDGSAEATVALAAVLDLARSLPSDVTLLQVLESGVDKSRHGEHDEPVEVRDARHSLEALAGRVRDSVRSVRAELARGAPAATIASIAREREADVIALTTHSRGGMARLALGSVAAAAVQRATMPLLIVGPAALERATIRAPSVQRDR